jgi:predicted membrane metal-binding protein
LKPKPRVPIWRWAVWWLALAIALLLFYVLLTPIWIGLRAAAWAAEFRARRRPSTPRR